MIISFLVGLVETKSILSFSSGMPSTDSTIFWNIVLFLREDKEVKIFSGVLKNQLIGLKIVSLC